MCIDYCRAKAAEKAQERRHAVLAAMGGECVRCGFDDWRALQIDHVNSGGTAEHQALGNGTTRFYAKVLANPDDYQLLCANCNTIKKWETPQERSGPKRLAVAA
jgi:5-methylcytosine-specific restriction endonuclease McrA